MNVYLFELDSVRNSEAEIARGQEALFREIAVNGNTVVLSYNQLSDSAAFWAGLREEKTYSAIMELCRLGRIQVSLFAGHRTAAQYILEHIRECMRRLDNADSEQRQFYFSLVPLDADDRGMLEDVYHAIQYSDVQLLKEKSQNEAANGEKYLFLYRYAELILMLSRSDTANRRQRQEPFRTLTDFLTLAERELSGTDAAIARAVSLLRRLSHGTAPDALQRRSVWYRLLDAEPFSSDVCAAEAVIDLCYNYAVEDSMHDIDRRFDSDEADFSRCFRADMEQYMHSAELGEHIFHHQDDARRSAQTDFADTALPEWDAALELVRRNMEYSAARGKTTAPPIRGESRGARAAAQKRQWSRLTKRSLLYRLLLAALYVLAFIVINYLLNVMQDAVKDGLGIDIGLGGRFLLDFILIVVFGILSSVLFLRAGLPDILETVQSIIGSMHENRILKKYDKKARRKD